MKAGDDWHGTHLIASYSEAKLFILAYQSHYARIAEASHTSEAARCAPRGQGT